MNKKVLMGIAQTVLLTTVGVLVAFQVQKQLDMRATSSPNTADDA